MHRKWSGLISRWLFAVVDAVVEVFFTQEGAQHLLWCERVLLDWQQSCLSFSFDLGDEWQNWRVDDLEPESDDTAEEVVQEKRKKHLRHDWKGVGKSAETADGRWVMHKRRAGANRRGVGHWWDWLKGRSPLRFWDWACCQNLWRGVELVLCWTLLSDSGDNDKLTFSSTGFTGRLVNLTAQSAVGGFFPEFSADVPWIVELEPFWPRLSSSKYFFISLHDFS